MTTNWVKDIRDMYAVYEFRTVVTEQLKLRSTYIQDLLEFRKQFLEEELNELKSSKQPEDVVDALIDICVVAIGTLDLLGVDTQRAWDEVHQCNMKKQVGSNDKRFGTGMPDLIKPEGWIPPDHSNNTGIL